MVNIVLTQKTSFEYSSTEGLLYDVSKGEPLSLLTSNDGNRVLTSMLVNKKFVPSVLEDNADGYNLYLQTTSGTETTTDSTETTTDNTETTDSAAKITVYRQDKCLIPMGEVLSNE